MVDVSLSQRAILELRREVCADLASWLVEVGFGSGLNLAALPAQSFR